MLQKLSPFTAIEQPAKEHRFDLREAIGFAWRHWKFIASVVGVTLLVAVVYVLKQTPLYTATAQVLLEPPKVTRPGNAILSEDSIDLTDALIENQLAIIRSTVFLRRVVQKEHLVSDPEFGSRSPPEAQGVATAAAETKPAAAENRGHCCERVGFDRSSDGSGGGQAESERGIFSPSRLHLLIPSGRGDWPTRSRTPLLLKSSTHASRRPRKLQRGSATASASCDYNFATRKRRRQNSAPNTVWCKAAATSP